jgi:hypothetical protein
LPLKFDITKPNKDFIKGLILVIIKFKFCSGCIPFLLQMIIYRNKVHDVMRRLALHRLQDATRTSLILIAVRTSSKLVRKTSLTTGSPSSVSVAFIRVGMGILNDSFFAKNT